MLTPHEQLAHFMYEPKVVPGPGVATTPSSLYLALFDSRVTSGRHRETGEVVDPDPPAKWLGAIGYMAILDLLGTAVRRIATPSQDNVAFRRTLESFSPVPDADRRALYALRNAFAHDYSLVNVGNAGNHLFRLQWNAGGPLVTPPGTAWDGNYPTSADETEIDLYLFTQVVEDVVTEVKAAHVGGDLELAVDPQEAEDRYFVTIT